jgi:anti-repressor protein
MFEIKIFESPDFGTVRTVVIDCIPYAYASDVARALGYEKPNNAINMHCRKVRKIAYPKTEYAENQPFTGMDKGINVIPKSDIRRLVIHSHLPQAEVYADWIFEEVLESIEEHGAYMRPDFIEKMLADPDVIIQTMTVLKKEREKNKALEQSNSNLKTKKQSLG